MDKRKVYLDYAATTPLDPRVLAAMRPYFGAEFGNPGSLHSFGQRAMAAVDGAREKIAVALNVDFREIIFTGSATEANNLALRGIIQNAEKILRRAQNDRRGKDDRMRIIVSAIEHESVLETARDLEKEGVEVIYLPVDKNGIVKLAALRSELTANTVLVSVMYVNNETGAVQPIAEISEIIRNFREENRGKDSSPSALNDKQMRSRGGIPRDDENGLDSRLRGNDILFHTDAAQALQFFDCDPEKLGVDLMTISAHKIYGPKGVGALYVANSEQLTANSKNVSGLKADRLSLKAILTGGGQEFGLRSGTENVPAIAGFAKAVELAIEEREKNKKHAAAMKERFIKGLKKVLRFAQNDNGGAPHILNVWIPGHKAEDVLTALDLNGVAVSAGSACRARSLKTSYVLGAMGLPKKRAAESIRISFGKMTTGAEIDAALAVLKKVLS